MDQKETIFVLDFFATVGYIFVLSFLLSCGLRPLPPAPLVTGHSEDCVGCWFGYVVNFICKAFVEIDLKNDIIV